MTGTQFKFSFTDSGKLLSIIDGINSLVDFSVDDFLMNTVSLKSRIHAYDQYIADTLFFKKT
jgi:hypothetical protein